MQIRRSTQHVLAATIAASTLVLSACGSGDDPADTSAALDPAADQGPGEPADRLSDAHLLTGADAIYPNGGSDWRESDTIPGDGHAAFNPCARRGLAGLGATSVYVREFEFVVTETGDVEPSLTFNEIVGEFASEDEAAAAYAEVQGWLEDCLPAGADHYDAGELSPVDVPAGTAERQLSIYGPVDERLDPYGDEGWFLETGLVLAGDRLAVLTQLTHGQDYNWPDGTPVTQMLPTAAARLVGDVRP